MQKSQSIFSFRPRYQQTESRSQHRSSLDTFIIPGRTRLPSSETSQSSLPHQDAMNLQIAESLLKHRIMSRSRRASTKPSLERSERGLNPRVSQRSPTPRSGNGRHSIAPQSSLHSKRRPERQQPASSSESQNPLSNYSIHPVQFRIAPRLPLTETPKDTSHDQMDGPVDTDSGYQTSRTTSTGTVSRRIISDSSTGSQISRASKYRDIYNSSGKELGIHLLKGDDEGSVAQMGNGSSQTKVIEKPLRRLLNYLRRSSSSDSLNAKTTDKSLPRKMSLASFRLHSQSSPSNVLTGQTLEDVCRLGGLGTLILPGGFSIDQLKLPICLSASAKYILNNGRNAPGIFRMCGYKTTADALYQYFDTQFSCAGSPSKVEETVATGLLPNRLECTLNDIASSFKTIIRGLPGGLLGSLETFEALRSTLLDRYSEPGPATLVLRFERAKLVALAISSIPSLLRQYLIHAVVGLVAYLGFEADKIQQAERDAVGTPGQHDQPSSEVMGYEALSKIFGSVLLGDLIDSVHLKKADVEPGKEIKPGNVKEGEKQKQTQVPANLGESAVCSANADHYNLTADVMYSLLLNWKETVIQLRKIDPFGKSSPQLHMRAPTNDASRLTPRNSAEHLELLDIPRGRTLPTSAKGPVRMKSKVTAKSRSSMPRADIELSEASRLNRQSPPTFGRVEDGSNSAKAEAAKPTGFHDLLVEDISRRRVDNQDNSNLHTASSKKTPCKQSHTESSNYAPRTVVKRMPTRSERNSEPTKDLPLPAIPLAQEMQYIPVLHDDSADVGSHKQILSNVKSRQAHTCSDSSALAIRPSTPHAVVLSGESRKWMPSPVPESEHKATFPPRQSSLPEAHYYPLGVIDPLPIFQSCAEQKPWINANPPSSGLRSTPHKNDAFANTHGQITNEATILTSPNRPFSYESSRDSEFTLDAPKVGHETRTEGQTSSGIDSPYQTEALMPINSQLNSDSSDRDKTYKGLGDCLKNVLSDRRGSINPLLDDVRHLLRRLDQGNDESQPARRGLDNFEETAGMRDSSPFNVSSRGSCSKGVLNEDVKEVKKEVSFRNTRAYHPAKTSAEMNREIDEQKRKLKACLVDGGGRQPESVLDLYMD